MGLEDLEGLCEGHKAFMTVTNYRSLQSRMDIEEDQSREGKNRGLG